MHTLCFLFPRWGAAHFSALAVLAVAALLMLALGRRRRALTLRLLAAALLLCLFSEVLWRSQSSAFPLYPDGLPLHFCSVMMPIAAAALALRQRWAAVLTCFTVPVLCAQALITPALDATWPSPRYFFFFGSHGLLLLAALALPLLADWRARRGDPLRAVLTGDVYLLLIHPFNLWLGTNYGFTTAAAPGSILCALGPAPQYYLWLQVPALLLFLLMAPLYRPRGRALTPQNALGWSRESLALKPRCIQPPKELEQRDGLTRCRMPAELPMLHLSGCKVTDGARSRITLQRSGCFARTLPAEELTALRTGATAAWTVQQLARSDWQTVAIVGLGAVGQATLRCLRTLFPERRVTLLVPDYKDTFTRAQVPPAWTKRLLRPEDRPDVWIFCLPVGVHPSLTAEQVSAGGLVLPVSYSGFTGLAPVFDRIFTDDLPQLRARAELAHLPIAGETLTARRHSDTERLLCYNLGCAVQDIYIAAQLCGMVPRG